MSLRSSLSIMLLFTAIMLSAGCGGDEIESRWRDRDISIDGDAKDWRGTGQLTDD